MDTAMFSHINWLAVAVAAAVYFMLGAIWYSKALFGNQWIKSTGIDMNNPEAKKGVGGVMVFTFVLEFIVCIGLAILVYRLGLVDGFMSGIKLGLLTGICFSGVAIAVSYLYQQKPGILSFIDGGYHLLGTIVASIILVLWQ
jgi:hypothetical protein